MDSKQMVECPYCDGMANLQKEARDLIYRKDQFKILAHFYKCEKCEEEFTTTEADTISLIQAHNQYRQKYNIPFPEEIATIRDKYELSAAKMSEVLGLGANGYSNYEKGEMPVPALAKLIATAAKPTVFMEFLMDARPHFSDNAFQKVKEKVEFLIDRENEFYPFYSSLNIYKEANNFTGYKRPNEQKIAGLVAIFIQKCKQEFNDKLKLNKLLFYTDFCHYKNYGSSISGLSYRAIQYGPVPANYDNIYSYLENEQTISSEWIRLSNGSAREVFKTTETFDINLFSPDEQKTIDMVIARFHQTSTWDIVDLSHKEKAWKELESGKELISYQDYAFDLAIV
jgi:putative zinc finger/helix-turn-helix YgiT family protein